MIRVHFHFSVEGFSNCYVIGPVGGGNAILVDPGKMTVPLLRTIEDNGYQPKCALITHAHPAHIGGLSTILKIYNLEVFAKTPSIGNFPTTLVADGDSLACGDISIGTIFIGGHSSDSVVYRIHDALFTGDTLSAGHFGRAPNAYARALMIETIRERIFTLRGEVFVYPGHGPPSTVEIERQINPEHS